MPQETQPFRLDERISNRVKGVSSSTLIITDSHDWIASIERSGPPIVIAD